MKRYLLTSVFFVLATIVVYGQDFKKDLGTGKKTLPEYKIPQIDTTMHKLYPVEGLIRQESTINIPNIFNQKVQNSDMPVKNLNGASSIRMPGTEKLDKSSAFGKQIDTAKMNLFKK